jgi:ribosome-binding protein aMBF1 (putative translation factor)
MSTNWNNKKDIQRAFHDLITPSTYEEKIKDEARLIMARFLSEVETNYKKKGWRRKDLAKKIGTSPSYITQLFRGTKLINLEMIAKMQDALNIKFKISSVGLDEESSLEKHESS